MENAYVVSVSWLETYYEIVSMIERVRADDAKMNHPKFAGIKSVQEWQGSAGFYDFAKVLTDEFEKLHANTKWGEDESVEEWLDWFDEVAEFFYEHPLVTGQ